jgi:transcriptional regulator of acetoin/glycerol metabolism
MRPVWLHRSEHFFNDTAIYSCAGAPLWGSQGECIGMLDLTGVQTAERPELMHLAALSARSISNALLLRQPHHMLLRLNWPGRSMGDDNDGLVLLGSEGEVLGANPWAREMLNLHAHPQVHASDVFALPWGLLFDAANSDQAVEVPLWSGLQLQARVYVQHGYALDNQPKATGPLQQLQSAMISKAIEQAVPQAQLVQRAILSSPVSGLWHPGRWRAAHRRSDDAPRLLCPRHPNPTSSLF